MLPTTSLRLTTTLRPVLFGTFAPRTSRCRPQPTQHRLFSASPTKHGLAKYPNVAALLIPEFQTSSITEIAPDDLLKTSSLSSAPGQPLEDELTKLYTKNPATFVYAESDFYKLKKNTRVPEVCVLGRSNVGKSSFVNALADRTSNGLAFVSTKAGKTRSINTYGFGPAPTIKELEARAPEGKDEGIPTHTFHLVDMPGYGHASLKEWGKNISLYLNKRTSVKGAIVLIDAEVGPKDSDCHLLQLLNAAQLKTAVVLTKADKVKKGLQGLRETCTKVWDAIRAIESRTTDGNWVWEKDVYVTAVGARDSAVVKSTVTTARLAVARLAGLIKDERPNTERNKRWSGKMISFDDLQYASGGSNVTGTGGDHVRSTQPAPVMASPPKRSPTSFSSESAFADLEQAAKAQHSGQARGGTSLGRRGRIRSRRAHTRSYHSTPFRSAEGSHEKPTGAELKIILDEFVQSLKTDMPRDHVRRLQQEREKWPRKLFKTTLKKSEERQARRLRQAYPEQTIRAQAVLRQRLEIERGRARARAIREAHAKMMMEREWPAADDTVSPGSITGTMDKNTFGRAFASSSGLDDRKRGQTKK